MNLRTLLSVLLLFSAPAFATEYTMRSGTLKFAGEQQGEVFEGRFDRFTPVVRIDPAAPASGSIDVTIDLASANTLNTERDEALKGDDFFAVARFPKARFVTTAMRRIDATRYEADAKLTIRDKVVALKFPFTFEALPDGGARLKAEVALDRLAFGLGGGDWADPGMIGHNVDVIVDVSLVAKP